MYINKIVVYGRLGSDPELKALPNGTSVVNFSMATTRTWKDKNGQKQEETEWHRCVIFGKRADVIKQYVHKGDKFYIEGRLKTRSWETDGVKKYSTEIMIEDFSFGDNPKKDGAQISSGTEAPSPASIDTIEYPEEEINPDDIPF